VYNFKVAATPAEPLLVSTAFDFIAKQDLISKGLKETPQGTNYFQAGLMISKGSIRSNI
jgi:hypothetical protein